MVATARFLFIRDLSDDEGNDRFEVSWVHEPASEEIVKFFKQNKEVCSLHTSAVRNMPWRKKITPSTPHNFRGGTIYSKDVAFHFKLKFACVFPRLADWWESVGNICSAIEGGIPVECSAERDRIARIPASLSVKNIEGSLASFKLTAGDAGNTYIAVASDRYIQSLVPVGFRDPRCAEDASIILEVREVIDWNKIRTEYADCMEKHCNSQGLDTVYIARNIAESQYHYNDLGRDIKKSILIAFRKSWCDAHCSRVELEAKTAKVCCEIVLYSDDDSGIKSNESNSVFYQSVHRSDSWDSIQALCDHVEEDCAGNFEYLDFIGDYHDWLEGNLLNAVYVKSYGTDPLDGDKIWLKVIVLDSTNAQEAIDMYEKMRVPSPKRSLRRNKAA